MLSEDQLVERTGRVLPSILGWRGSGIVRIGIGDDAAVLAPGRRTDWVITCDQFLEDVHFLAGIHPPDSVGYKALVRAASDIAAMGAAPRFFLLSMALPANRTGAWFDAYLKGMARAARALGMRLIGGDTTEARSVSVDITVLGEIARGRAVTRSGARPGDIICVSGRLGRAQLGLELVRRGVGHNPRFRNLLRPHFYPQIRLELGAWLARHRLATAMMDISDGLSTDLGRLCRASRVGALLWEERVPAVETPASGAKRLPGKQRDAVQMALHGGDDYGLLFTVAPRDLKRLKRAPGFRELTPIGEIVRGRRVELVGRDGSRKLLKPHGWDPFRRS